MKKRVVLLSMGMTFFSSIQSTTQSEKNAKFILGLAASIGFGIGFVMNEYKIQEQHANLIVASTLKQSFDPTLPNPDHIAAMSATTSRLSQSMTNIANTEIQRLKWPRWFFGIMGSLSLFSSILTLYQE